MAWRRHGQHGAEFARVQHVGFVRMRRRDGTMMVVSEVVPLGCGTKARKSFVARWTLGGWQDDGRNDL